MIKIFKIRISITAKYKIYLKFDKKDKIQEQSKKTENVKILKTLQDMQKHNNMGVYKKNQKKEVRSIMPNTNHYPRNGQEGDPDLAQLKSYHPKLF